jgi:peptidase E
MGGGGFSMEPENTLLDHYVLSQARSSKPRICFLGTASGDAAGYVEKFYTAFSQQACEPTHLMLFHTPPPDVAALVARQHIFYVGGGSTRNLLVLWREWGLDRMLKRAWRNGAVMCGLSAGSLCWFESGVSDSFGPTLQPVQALGWLRGSHCPHYDGEMARRPAYHQMVRRKTIAAGYAADDGAALHFKGKRLHRVISSRPGAKVYRVSLSGRDVIEREMPTEYLGQRGGAK